MARSFDADRAPQRSSTDGQTPALAGVEARSLQVRLLVAVTGVSAAFLVLVGVVAVERITGLIRSNVHTAALDLVAVKAKEIEGFFTERGRIVTTLFTDPTVLGWFAGYDEFRRPLEGDAQYQQVIGFFRALTASDESVVSVFMATDSTSEYFYSEGRVERAGYDPKGRWWWAEALGKDRLYVSPPGVDAGTGDISVTVQTTVYTPEGRLLGVGGIDVLLGTLGELVGEITYQGAGHAFLVDDLGQIVYFPGMSFEPERVGDRLTTRLEAMDTTFAGSSGFAGVARSIADQVSGLGRACWRGEDVMVVWAPVRARRPELQWTLGLMVPDELITASIRRARIQALAAALVAVLAIAGLTLAATNRVVTILREHDRRLARNLAQANVRLEEASRMKTQFLATMSHELRTPLNSIIGFSDILRRRLDADADPRFHRFADNIHRAGQHLLALISEILDLSRIEAGRLDLDPETFAVARTVDGVCEIARGAGSGRVASVEVDCPEDVGELEADPIRFKQILFNLLSNAVKFSGEGSPVRVVVRGLVGHESPLGVASVRVAVVDRGIGIDARDREAIFDEFRQLEAWGSRKYSGAGLGLALVKRLVDLHRGAIDVESSPGEGSTFTVTLPRSYRGPLPEGQDRPPAT